MICPFVGCYHQDCIRLDQASGVGWKNDLSTCRILSPGLCEARSSLDTPWDSHQDCVRLGQVWGVGWKDDLSIYRMLSLGLCDQA